MSRYRGPKLRIVRRLGELPGFTTKTTDRLYPPGQHGPAKANKKSSTSEYGLRLQEKQKLRFNYGVSEKQLFSYKNIFFFQILPSTKILKRFKNKNIMWAPMYDSPHFPYGFSDHFWKIIKYYDIKVLCFSNRLKKQLIKHKINHLNLKYQVDPEY